jgi:hypothetical protein
MLRLSSLNLRAVLPSVPGVPRGTSAIVAHSALTRCARQDASHGRRDEAVELRLSGPPVHIKVGMALRAGP